MHWTIEKKAVLIKGVRSGELLLPDVLNAYDISIEEWLEWCVKYAEGNKEKLRVSCPMAGLRQSFSRGRKKAFASVHNT